MFCPFYGQSVASRDFGLHWHVVIWLMCGELPAKSVLGVATDHRTLSSSSENIFIFQRNVSITLRTCHGFPHLGLWVFLTNSDYMLFLPIPMSISCKIDKKPKVLQNSDYNTWSQNPYPTSEVRDSQIQPKIFLAHLVLLKVKPLWICGNLKYIRGCLGLKGKWSN